MLDNSLVRVRWDNANTDGLMLERWNGTAWTEAGKLLIWRIGDTSGFCDTLVRAELVASDPERATVRMVLRRAADSFSREEVFVTLQRGWLGPRVEVYPSPLAAGTPAGAAITYTMKASGAATATRQDAVVANAQPVQQTDTTFSASYSAAVTLGAGTFSVGENHATLLPNTGEGAANVAVVQTGVSALVFGDSSAWGAARNGLAISGTALGYVSAQWALPALAANQNLEAESMTLSAGTAAGADAGASGGNAASATRVAEADHVTRATYTGGRYGRFRILARVRNAAAGTLNVRAQTGATTGAIRSTTSTTYVWLDLGEIVFSAAADTLQIRAWRTGAGTLWVDRVVGYPVEQRDGTAALYDGSRDPRRRGALADGRAPAGRSTMTGGRMAKGDVVGVAAHVEAGRTVVRLQLDHGKDDHGNPVERPGDEVVWDSDRGAWCTRKADDEITDGERRTYRAKPVPGAVLDPQPPQEPAVLTAEVIERGVTAKARAILVADGGGPAVVTEYLADRLSVKLIDRDMAERIAARVGAPAPKGV